MSVGKYFTSELTNKNNPLEKLLLVIYAISVSPSVINLPMDLKTYKHKFFFLPTSFHWHFPWEVCHITNGIPFIILLVFLFVH